MWKVQKVKSINIQSDYKATSKRWTDKKKTNLFWEFCKNVQIPRKQVQDSSKKFLGNNNEKDFLENHQLQWSLHNKYRQSKPKIASNWLLTVPYLQHWYTNIVAAKILNFKLIWDLISTTSNFQMKALIAVNVHKHIFLFEVFWYKILLISTDKIRW